ncbi:hypothetical protein JB92DRAFT_1685214 [Gautieria morchelliformis]|nr:hypothetical protein JB92DRAFT_1685214 [Gautieria morchelliformis]
MPTLPTETLASDLRTTYVITNVAQYDEIPPPNTLEAQPEETAEPIATLEMLPQDNLEDPAHPLDVVQRHPPHDPEMGLPGLSTCPVQRPSAFPLTGDLEPRVPGRSQGQPKRHTCMDKEATETKELQGRGKRPRILSEKGAIAEQECAARTSLSASHSRGAGKGGSRGSRGRGAGK